MQVNHSGNQCSGLCEAPCGHAGCWQCGEEGVSVEDQQAAVALMAAADAPVSAKRINADTREQDEVTTITRAALSGLATRAGLDMDWNDGDPVFREVDDPEIMREKAAAKRQVKVLEKKLEDERQARAAERQALGAAQQIARSADEALDEMMSKVLNGRARDPLFTVPGPSVTFLPKLEGDADDVAAAEALLADDKLQFKAINITDIVEKWKGYVTLPPTYG